jgi:PTH1 family peptidyl-tRNA hydrolase
LKLIVGLGNPGSKYRGTRHNVGYDVLTCLARRQPVGPMSVRFQGEVVDFRSPAGTVLLLSPTTFMNCSGRSVRAAMDFYKIPLQDVLLICDDLNLPLGRMRFRARGSAGGQKGLADVIRTLGTEEFARLRVGIGSPPASWDVADFVLSRYTDKEEPVMRTTMEQAAVAVEDWIARGIEHCMNRYNGAADEGSKKVGKPKSAGGPNSAGGPKPAGGAEPAGGA